MLLRASVISLLIMALVLLSQSAWAASATIILGSPFVSTSTIIQWRDPGVSVPGTLTANGSSQTITRVGISARSVELRGPTLSNAMLTGGTLVLEQGSHSLTVEIADYTDTSEPYQWAVTQLGPSDNAARIAMQNALSAFLGGYSSSSNVTMRFDDGQPDPPSIASVQTTPYHNRVDVTLNLDNFPSGGTVEAYYQWRGGAQTNWSNRMTHRANAASSSFTIAGLASDTAYDLRVTLNILSWPEGTQVSFRTAQQQQGNVPPAPPRSPTLAAGSSPGQLVVSWTASVSAGVTGYRWAVLSGGATVASGNAGAAATSATATGLYNGSYSASVWAIGPGGESLVASTPPLAYTGGEDPPPPPDPSDAPPPESTGFPPQQIHWRDRLCYGFPGCPDSYVFLVPVIVGVMVGGAQRAAAGGGQQGRGRQQQKASDKVFTSPAFLVTCIVASFIGTAVLMQISPLKMFVYFLVPIAVGMVWLVWRRG